MFSKIHVNKRIHAIIIIIIIIVIIIVIIIIIMALEVNQVHRLNIKSMIKST